MAAIIATTTVPSEIKTITTPIVGLTYDDHSDNPLSRGKLLTSLVKNDHPAIVSPTFESSRLMTVFIIQFIMIGTMAFSTVFLLLTALKPNTDVFGILSWQYGLAYACVRVFLYLSWFGLSLRLAHLWLRLTDTAHGTLQPTPVTIWKHHIYMSGAITLNVILLLFNGLKIYHTLSPFWLILGGFDICTCTSCVVLWLYSIVCYRSIMQQSTISTTV